MTSLTSVPETLRGLVERYSPSGQEAEAAAWLAERMRTLGAARTFLDAAGNAVGVWGTGGKQIVLLGHLDTVPGWIEPRMEGDLFYGRGTVDAKGPLAAFVDGAAALENLNGWEVIVIGAVGEEADSEGARYAAGHYHPQFAVIGEPSRWDRVTLGYKGSAAAQLTVRRPVAHSARRDENACEAAVRVWQRVRAWVDEHNLGREPAFEQILCSLRGFQSNGDGFEESASLQIGARLPPHFAPDDWYAQLIMLAAPEKLEQRGFAIPAYRGDKNNRLVRAFLGALRGQGAQPGFVLKTGTADLNIVAPAWGCPALAYGPGDSALDHTPHEHLALAEYARAVRVITAVLRQICE
jgi:LysW-gamma-L-lysine carboxypeptidase